MDESHIEGTADRRMRSDRRGESKHKGHMDVERRFAERRSRTKHNEPDTPPSS